MPELRALTIRQPHASLVAVGAKTIETRSRPTAYRGPLLIHAGKATPEVHGYEDGPYGEIGDVDARWFQYGRDEDGPDWRMYDTTSHGGPTPTPGEVWPLPLGAVVASCQLIDCVPIVGPEDDPLGPFVYCDGDWLQVHDGPDDSAPRYSETEPAFGDFAPGRWAWLLGDVKATTERCPRCWGEAQTETTGHRIEGGAKSCRYCNRTFTFNFMRDQGAVRRCDCIDARRAACPTCECRHRCAPVPMRGRQSLWIPTPEDWPA